MANPMISVGVLNRVRASVKFTDHSELNVSASYLAREGVEISVQGNFTEFLPAMTGAVQSTQPYVIIQARVHLVRSQALAAQYKKQWETNSAIGDAKLYTDSSTFGDFELTNAAITNIQDMSFAGNEPGVVLTITGTYYVNADMWSI